MSVIREKGAILSVIFLDIRRFGFLFFLWVKLFKIDGIIIIVNWNWVKRCVKKLN